MSTTHRTGHRLFFTRISAVDKNCVEILKHTTVVATINRVNRVIVKGYHSLVIPLYATKEANAIFDNVKKSDESHKCNGKCGMNYCNQNGCVEDKKPNYDGVTVPDPYSNEIL